jgi:hypothetical protein
MAELSTVPRVVGRGESLGEVALDTAPLGVHATPSRVRLLLRWRVLPAAAPAPDSPAGVPAAPTPGAPGVPRDSAPRPRPLPPDTTVHGGAR